MTETDLNIADRRELVMSLGDFRSALERLLPDPYLRPFVCDGSPLACRIFIVGINSARDSGTPFWNYWSESYGFKKAELITDLERLPGGLTRTRKNIERIAEAAGRGIVLDTNIYLPATARAAELTTDGKGTQVFEFLLRTIRPRIVFTHGRPPFRFFQRRCAEIVERGDMAQKVVWDSHEFQLICARHLSLTGSERASDIGYAISRVLDSTSP